MVDSKEELQKVLNDFWLLDCEDYENIESMLDQEIYESDKLLEKIDDKDGTEKYARDELVVLREKIRYIISNGLYKK